MINIARDYPSSIQFLAKRSKKRDAVYSRWRKQLILDYQNSELQNDGRDLDRQLRTFVSHGNLFINMLKIESGFLFTICSKMGKSE